jgi:hypothetical protein
MSGALRLGAAQALLLILASAPLLGSAGCDGGSPTIVAGQFFASPILVEGPAGPTLILADEGGKLSAFEAETTLPRWTLQLTAPPGQDAYLFATPVAVEGRLVVSYHTQDSNSGVRKSHRVVVIDIASGELDEAFPAVELAARKPASDGSGWVEFNPATAFGRAALAHGRIRPASLGFVYASYGNAATIQPYHGWVFEIDLERWKSAGADAAITSALLVTPEMDCGVEGKSGAYQMICGGGVWTPAGPQIFPTSDGFELIVPTGNGQLDLGRRDYANSLMRVKPGLRFDSGCDPQRCDEFDPIAPSEACLASCRNLFVPRLLPGDPPLRPASGRCDGKTFLECYALLDADLGSCAPVKVELEEGLSVFVQPGKDGSVYLLDADHMGTLYDRETIVEFCGAPADDCTGNQWRGMIVTQPTLTEADGVPVVLVATFNFDETHPAGVVALKIRVVDGVPSLEPFWQVPDVESQEAVERFRHYPSRIALSGSGSVDGATAWVVEGSRHEEGTIHGIRVRDGQVVARIRMQGHGRKFVLPVIHDGRLFAPSNPDFEIHRIFDPGSPLE